MKLKNLTKTCLLGVILTLFPSILSAQVTTADLAGTYKFNSTMTLEDQAYAGYLDSSFEFSIVNSSETSVQIKSFFGADFYATFNSASGTIEFNSQSISGMLGFSNAAGDFPWGDQNTSIYLTWSVAADGSISVPDFTIVEMISYQEATCSTVAKFTDCSVEKQASEDSGNTGDFSFAGTYNVNAYVQDADASGFMKDFEMEIIQDGDYYYVTKIAGYDVPEMYGVPAISGSVDGNVFTIPVSSAFLTMGGQGVILGGNQRPGSVYNPELAITLTHNSDGTFTLSAFTTWNYDLTTAESVYTYEYLWSPLGVTSDNVGGDGGSEAVDFSGSYTVTGKYMSYSDYQFVDSEFTLTIEANPDEANAYYITEIAGYDTSETYYGGPGVNATASGNTLSISPVGDTYLTSGAEYYLLGDTDYSGYNPSGAIKLTYNDGVWSLDEFMIYEHSWITGEYKAVAYWSGLAVEKDGGDVIDPTPTPSDDPFVGTFEVEALRIDYTNNYAQESVTFPIVVAESGSEYYDYDVLAIAGYDTSEVYYGGCGVIANNKNGQFVIYPVGNTYLTAGAVYDLLGNASYAEEYEAMGSIAISFADNAYALEDFSVWSFNWNTSEYSRKYFYLVNSITKVAEGDDDPDSGIENVVASGAAKVSAAVGTIFIDGDFDSAAIYDIAGRTITPAAKAANAVSAGIYVVVVDGNATKVLVK